MLAPTLFIVFVNAILHVVDSKLSFRNVNISYRTGRNLFDTCRLRAWPNCRKAFISKLQYDIMTELQDTLNVFDQAHTTFELKINAGKTKILETNVLRCVPLVNGEAVGRVGRFFYLGSTVAENLYIDIDIQRRMQAATKAMYKRKHRVFNQDSFWRTTKVAAYAKRKRFIAGRLRS